MAALSWHLLLGLRFEARRCLVQPGRFKEQKKKVAAKYYDPSSGATWSGRGKPPKWIDGKERDSFLIR
ncbi:MAG: H-NS histone family protein [Trichocoleus desertorum ATA4-8-CV12]|nr:H-NS histone family protein [Trichocoleus desertorum ATA4-8-CV12]